MTCISARNYVRTPDNFRLNWPRVWTLRTLTSQNVRARKRSREASDQASSSSSGPSTKKRVVQRRTVEKWIVENDKAMNTASWLQFETAPPPDRDRVAVLKCAVCTQFKEKLESMRNFKPAFIEGTSNVLTSTFKEHATSDMQLCFFLKKRAVGNINSS